MEKSYHCFILTTFDIVYPTNSLLQFYIIFRYSITACGNLPYTDFLPTYLTYSTLSILPPISQNDVQAMARCHRIGQSKRVTVYRLITRRSVEAEMFDRASRKLGLEQVRRLDTVVEQIRENMYNFKERSGRVNDDA